MGPSSVKVNRILEAVTKRLGELSGTHQAAIIGVSGPQGSGKTTVTRRAAQILNDRGINTIAISVDDFYLKNSLQQQLTAKGNRFLAGRGCPGSHDTALMKSVLEDLHHGKLVAIPQYDKSLCEGQGDQVDPLDPPLEPYKVVLLEGWLLGFRPIGHDKVKAIVESVHQKRWAHPESVQDYREIDTILEKEYAPLWDMLDATICLKAKSLEYVYKWREQQETELRASRGSGMTPEQVVAFVDKFMPFYYLYSDTITFAHTMVIDFEREVIDEHNE